MFTDGSYSVAVCLWITEEAPLVHCFLKSSDMLVAIFEKDGGPSCTIPRCTNAYFNYGVDPLHPEHSINCAAVAVLHLLAPPPFSGHVSLIHAVQTIRARVDALQLRYAVLLRRVYALRDMIQCANSQVRIMQAMMSAAGRGGGGGGVFGVGDPDHF